MSPERLNRLLAGFVFLASFLVYFSTMAPTVSFWDCGEFIATSYRLGVPHPPGAPLFLILGRFFSLLPIPGDIAYRMNMISVITSALAIMLLYLIIVQFVRHWRGHINSVEDKIIAFGGGVIGALVFAFTDSHWFNAVEAEVYAVSTLSTALVVWLVLHWAERAEETGSERYILIIAYVLGLSTGVHLLNLLAIPFMAMIMYFRKRNFGWPSFTALMGIVLAIFLIIYLGIIKGLPKIAITFSKIMGTNEANIVIGSVLLFGILILSALFIFAGSISKVQKNLIRLGAASLLLIVIGYSSYEIIFIRSSQNPTIDENDPETVQAAISYLEREQYGNTDLFRGNTFNNFSGKIDDNKLFPRRGSRQGNHIKNYKNYSSDSDYFWRYQVKKMYWRYFLWQFAGRGPSVEAGVSRMEAKPTEDGVDWFQFGIPLAFLLGMAGMVYQFKRDYYQALSVLALFILTGIAIIFYLNQPDPQPRERDYSYVGSFFAFAIWVGIGASAIFDRILTLLRDKPFRIHTALGAGFILLIAAPVVMLSKNYHTHDRTGNYLPWDYSYNILQTCEPNGIIFTNGDNDTFPLWYLQEVEGIRTDVTVANLSLLNTPWYIRQLRDSRPEGERFINLTDDQIVADEELRRPRTPMKISDSLEKQYKVSGRFRLNSKVKETIEEEFTLIFEDFPVGDKSEKIKKELRKLGLKKVNNSRQIEGKERLKGSDITNFDYDVVEYNFVPYGSENNMGSMPIYLGALPWQDTKIDIPIGSGNQVISWTMQPTFSGKRGIRVQDLMVVHILSESAKQVDKNGKWKYPIYFASTVSPSNMINLNKYLKMEGLAFRVSSRPGRRVNYKKIRENLTTVVDDDWSREYKVGYKYRNLDNPDVYYNETTDVKLTRNWRSSFLQLASKEFERFKIAPERYDLLFTEMLASDVETFGDSGVDGTALLTYLQDRIAQSRMALDSLVSESPEAASTLATIDLMNKLLPMEILPPSDPIAIGVWEMYDVLGEEEKAAAVLVASNSDLSRDDLNLMLLRGASAQGIINNLKEILNEFSKDHPENDVVRQLLLSYRQELTNNPR